MEQQNYKLASEFIKNIDGRDFVLYAGLLDLAHQHGINQLNVELLQYPSETNDYTAVVKAAVYGKDGKIFIEIGDANPANTNSKVAKHIIRMAATRAKARAFRDYTNIGMTCLEELGDNDEIPASQPTQRQAQPPKQEYPKKEYQNRSDRNAPLLTEAQRRAINNLGKRFGMNEAEIQEYINDLFPEENLTLGMLTVPQASTVIKELQNRAA